MSSKKASHGPGLCPIKGQKSALCTRTRAQNQSWSPSLSTTRSSPPCPMLVFQPASYHYSYNMHRVLQRRLRPNKLLNRSISCQLVGNFVSSYPIMSKDPIQPHSMLCGDNILRLLALLYQWRRSSGGLKDFYSRLAVRANTHVLHRSASLS
jgi:hypothetical protein